MSCMNTLECDDCEAPIDVSEDLHAVLHDPWGNPTGDILCANCREARWYRWQEKMMEEAP